jgi:hypothetical protein
MSDLDWVFSTKLNIILALSLEADGYNSNVLKSRLVFGVCFSVR